MQGSINFLTDDNWTHNLPSLTKTPVRISAIKELESPINIDDIGMKYVLRGHEKYTVNNQCFELRDSEFLLVQKSQCCKVSIDAEEHSLGVCIDLKSDYLSQQLHAFIYPNELTDESVDHTDLIHVLFKDLKHKADQQIKLLLSKVFECGREGQTVINYDEIIKEISAVLIAGQHQNIKALFNIKAIKQSTRIENFKRITLAKQLIEQLSYDSDINMKEIAKQAYLSEFRMFHLFKESFGCSPYQYYLNKRIEAARFMKISHNLTWTEISHRLGFSDIASFSKTYKKVMGKAPTKELVV